MNRKGEGTSAGNVATLIAIIALFMIVYILLLTPEDRDRLLYGNETGKYARGGVYVEGEGRVFLSEFVGKLIPGEEAQVVVHDVANVNLFTSEESELVTLSESAVISKSLFGAKTKNLRFATEPRDLLKAELYLIVDSGEGNLVMRINGDEFYNNEVRSGQVKVEIPLYSLSQDNNLELSIEGFGSKTYRLRSIKLREEKEIKNRVARRTFSVSAEEKAKMNRAVMRYGVFCGQEEDESLRMLLNNKVLYSDVPFCNIKEELIEIAPHYFNAGVNILDFETEGDYVVEGIRVKTYGGKEEVLEYFFSLDEEDYKRVRRGLSDVVVVFDFSILDDRKAFTMEINGRDVDMDTTEDTLIFVLSDYVEEENLIRLDAKNSFEILEFKVILE